MFGQLARWLRAAGHDTSLAEPGGTDRTLLERAATEGRMVLTRDRKMLELREARSVPVVVLRCGLTPDCARELAADHGVDWQYAPLTRCLVDNAPLLDAGPDALELIPEGARRVATEVRRCPACERLYWEGGHARRMRQRLAEWAKLG